MTPPDEPKVSHEPMELAREILDIALFEDGSIVKRRERAARLIEQYGQGLIERAAQAVQIYRGSTSVSISEAQKAIRALASYSAKKNK